jgi:hypothetical protein
MKKLYIATLIGLFFSHANFTQTEQTTKILSKKTFKDFHAKFSTWQTKLSVEQKNFWQDLFSTYEGIYKKYLKNSHDKSNQMLLTEHQKSLDHVMQNWKSFYQEHTDIEIFNKTFQTWKNKLRENEQLKFKKLCADYQKAYTAYDKDPKNELSQQNIEKQMALLKNIM